MLHASPSAGFNTNGEAVSQTKGLVIPVSHEGLKSGGWFVNGELLVSLFLPSAQKAELRASVFEAIEEEDKVIEKDEGLPPALLGSCNDRAKQLHASPLGRLLTALICEYLDWAQLSHTLKVICKRILGNLS